MGRSAGDQGVSGYWEQSLRVRDEIVLEWMAVMPAELVPQNYTVKRITS